jgi:hypothetical protein
MSRRLPLDVTAGAGVVRSQFLTPELLPFSASKGPIKPSPE